MKEFRIHRYGPLNETGRIRLKNFNLFWGENEDGKTLTIEALVKILAGKVRKILPEIDRVSEEPDGFIILQEEHGHEIKIPEKRRITDLLSISAEEFINLFVIRNSDLVIAREAQFYGNITERLTGIRTTQLKNLKEKLRQIGNLTATMQVEDKEASYYLKTRLSNARVLLEESAALVQTAKENEFDKLEEKLFYLKKDLEVCEQGIEDLEKARLREKYESANSNFKKMKSARENMEFLDNFTSDELSDWQQAELSERTSREDIEKTTRKIDEKQKELDLAEKTLTGERTNLELLQSRKAKIEEMLKPLIAGHGRESEKVALHSPARKFSRAILVLVWLMIGLSAAGILLRPQEIFFYISGAIAVLVGMVLAVFYYSRFIYPQGKLEKLKQQIFYHAGNLGFSGEGIPQIQIQLEEFEESVQARQQNILNLEKEISLLRSTVEDLQSERLVTSQQKLDAARKTIQNIQIERNVKSIDEYKQRLMEKQEQEKIIAETASVLKNYFGANGNSPGEQIQYWESRVNELTEYARTSPAIVFNEEELKQKKAEEEEIRAKIEELQHQLQDFRSQLSEMGRQAQKVLLSPENAYPCQTLEDLGVIEEALQNFINEVETRQHYVGIAHDIFSEIEEEEEQKVSSLFGEESLVSKYFSQITNALYQAVHYYPDDSGIRVRRQDGVELPANWLSGGAYDQLYFAIRLALGEKLLGGQKGFFILDDPFIKADTSRLKRQMDILVEISRAGWQILYFSAKDEVLQVLRDYVDKKEITLLQVPKSNFEMNNA